MYDASIGRWNGVDQLAEKYMPFSSYHYAGNNPWNNIEVDGRYFVGKDGKEVEVTTRKNGKIKVGKNATKDLKKAKRLVNKSKEAREQFSAASKNGTKIHLKFDKVNTNLNGEYEGLFAIHQVHDEDGNILKWSEESNRFQGDVAFIEDDNGNLEYKEATLTIFEKNFENEDDINYTLEGLHDLGFLDKLFKNVGAKAFKIATIAHELSHDTDSEAINHIKSVQEKIPSNVNPEVSAYKITEKVLNELSGNPEEK